MALPSPRETQVQTQNTPVLEIPENNGEVTTANKSVRSESHHTGAISSYDRAAGSAGKGEAGKITYLDCRQTSAGADATFSSES